MRKNKFSTLLLTCLLGMVLIVGPGCIGGFNLTTNVHDWNSNLGSKWVNEIVFLAFVIVPVYGITLLGDGIIFNSIEFWGGENPISKGGGDGDGDTDKK